MGRSAVKLDTHLRPGPVYLHSPIRLHGVRLCCPQSVLLSRYLIINRYVTSHICITRSETASLDVALHVEGK